MRKKSIFRSAGIRVNGTMLSCMVLLSLSGLRLSGQVVDGIPPEDSVNTGYFPTLAEDTLLRGAVDSRSLGRGLEPEVIEGPDTSAQVATGLFRYYDAQPGFYERNENFFRPINKGLGVFTKFDALTIENSRPQHVSFVADGSLGLLTRTFDPNLAHIKAGPLYFDVLWAGAGVIYSDYNGDLPPSRHAGDDDDGWAAFIELGVRGLLRITDSIYISAVANVVYLPFENEVALRFGNADDPPLLLRFNVSDQIGEWEVLFFDEFRGVTGLDFLVNADSPAIDRAGRYHFGFIGDRSTDFYSSEDAYFINTIGFYASRPMFENQWRFNFGIEHSDYWRSFSFDDHRKREWLGLWFQYEGSVIPFAPRLSYEYVSTDGYNSLLHLLQLQLTGRFTENVNWYGKVGYGFSTGDTTEANRFLWEMALQHSITRSTLHSLSFGEGYFYNELVPDTRTARYVRYSIDQRISSQVDARLFVQYSDRERSSEDDFATRDRFGAGLRMTYRPLDFTQLRAYVYYDQADQSTTSDDSSRWLYRMELTQQLGFRLTGSLFYQYEEFSREVRPYNEHFMGLSVRRYF